MCFTNSTANLPSGTTIPWTDEVPQAAAVEAELMNMQKLFTSWNPATKMHVAILEENGNTHSLHRALSHAVILNVVRKMNGFVELDSPANALEPYLQNDNGWNQGQIFQPFTGMVSAAVLCPADGCGIS